MPVKLNSSGGGSVTLTTPSTASDFTVTVPAVTGTMSVQASASYTTGSVLFINSSAQVAQSNAQFFWDNTNNALGIGTNTPFSYGKLACSNPAGTGLLAVTNSDGGSGNGGSALTGYYGSSSIGYFNINLQNGSVPSLSSYMSFATAISGTTAERMRIDTSGNLLVTGGGGLGYGTGSGGTVTQATSKTTAVTLNKTTGKITMNNAALAASTTIQFTVNNTTVTNNDTIIVNLSGGTADGRQYNVWAWPDTNVFYMIVRNISAVSLSEALVINFAVIKGATS